MMNSHVAFVAHNDCLAPLCQHDFLPISFTFQVFDLVYMVDFIATDQKRFRISVFALFLCAICYRIFILQQPLLTFNG